MSQVESAQRAGGASGVAVPAQKTILEEKLGAEWAARGAELRKSNAQARWATRSFVCEHNDGPNSNYDFEGKEDETKYDAVTYKQQWYETMKYDAKSKTWGAPELRSDQGACAALARDVVARAKADETINCFDMGCHSGSNLEYFANAVLEDGDRDVGLFGIDFSEAAIQVAKNKLSQRKRGSHVLVSGSGAADLPEKLADASKGKCQGAIFHAVAQHIDAKDVNKVIENISASLVPGGLALVGFKTLLSEEEFKAIGLEQSNFAQIGVTADRALKDLRAQKVAPEDAEAWEEALAARLAGSPAAVKAVVYDVDYCPGGKALPAQTPGDHNRPFLFYSYDDMVERGAKYDLKPFRHEVYVDAKQPYGALYHEIIFERT